MEECGLHKLSHYINREGEKGLTINLWTGTTSINVSEAIKRALFLANVECKDVQNYHQVILNITFTRLKQLEYIIPIINENMKKAGFGDKFYYVDEECEKYFNGK